MQAVATNSRVTQLRRAFDASFAVSAERTVADTESFLAVRIAAAPYALRVTELASFARAEKIVPVRSGSAGLLGISGIRGAIVPVYSLAAMLNLPQDGTNQWLAVCGTKHPLALAFAEYEYFFSLAHAELCATDQSGVHVCEFAQHRGTARLVVHLPSVLKAITDGHR